MSTLNVLPSGAGAGEVRCHLLSRAREAFARRREEYEAIKSPAQLRAYARQRRAFFLEQLGGFPRRRPLKARTVGCLRGRGFRVEKVVFESQPHHLVTANLYLPAGRGPHPATLVSCGHHDDGKAPQTHQRLCMLLATNGIAAFCYDPIAQGERYQFLSDEGTRKYWPTLEHTLLGMGCIALGTNTARYRIWDGMRALDYLQGRDDIDGSRLGCTGYSGGGTLTSYLMALDPRITCAAPCCYLASLEQVVEVLGPQDAEQNIHGQIAFGMEHADYLLMGAPKPVLICAAARDFFPIDGVWKVFREAKSMYGRLGCPERIELAEDDVEHAFSPVLRAAATRWMRRWLLGKDSDVAEPDFPLFTERQLWCTPRGQVALVPGTRTCYDLNADWGEDLDRQRRRHWQKAPRREMRAQVRQVAGIPTAAQLAAATCQAVGTVRRRGHRIDKLIMEVEGRRVPALAFVPPRTRGDAYLYVHGEGKAEDADGAIAELVGRGHLVLAVDPSGCGETAAEGSRLYDANVFLAYLLGLSLIGLRAAEILVAARLLARYRPRRQSCRIHLVGIGAAGPAALHAAAVEPRRFASLTLRRSLSSWADLVRAPGASLDFLPQVVHGALQTYDLPDLVGLLPAGKVTVEDPLDPTTVTMPA
ncbi:alpha/beta hydrolase family protein [Candidatus Latescibacterota bacterium]